jgi:hypothetical protein
MPEPGMTEFGVTEFGMTEFSGLFGGNDRVR